MKKILVGVSVLLVAVVIFGAGFFFAQSNLVSAAGLPLGFGPGNMMGGRGGQGQGQVHEYVEQALADKLGLTKEAVETSLSNGKTMLQVVTDTGAKEADAVTLLTEVHKTALSKAVTEGLLTQAQADTMLKNMSANGFAYGEMGMRGRQDGRGFGGMHGGRGSGGMMGGWNVQATPAP